MWPLQLWRLIVISVCAWSGRRLSQAKCAVVTVRRVQGPNLILLRCQCAALGLVPGTADRAKAAGVMDFGIVIQRIAWHSGGDEPMQMSSVSCRLSWANAISSKIYNQLSNAINVTKFNNCLCEFCKYNVLWDTIVEIIQFIQRHQARACRIFVNT